MGRGNEGDGRKECLKRHFWIKVESLAEEGGEVRRLNEGAASAMEVGEFRLRDGRKNAREG